MYTFKVLTFVFSLLFTILVYSQSGDEINCYTDFEIDQNEPQASGYSLYKPCRNDSGQYFKALVVFVQFENASNQNTDWPIDSLPNWADDFIDAPIAAPQGPPTKPIKPPTIPPMIAPSFFAIFLSSFERGALVLPCLARADLVDLLFLLLLQVMHAGYKLFNLFVPPNDLGFECSTSQAPFKYINP